MVMYACRGRRIAVVPKSTWATYLDPISKERKRGEKKERKGAREGRKEGEKEGERTGLGEMTQWIKCLLH